VGLFSLTPSDTDTSRKEKLTVGDFAEPLLVVGHFL